jgi:hypothetical protein
VDEEIRLIREMVDSYLKGFTFQSIVDSANASGTKPPRAQLWTRTVVKRIITNRFYAGVTTFGKYKTIQGKRIPVPPSQWVSGEGQHQALYDEATYLAILNESERRETLRSRGQVYALTGLLTCSICGSRLHRHGKLGTPYPVDLSCPEKHLNIYYDLALQIVSRELVKQLQAIPPAKQPESLLAQYHARNSLLLEQRQQIQDGYEARLYTLREAQTKIVAIETESEKLARQHDRDTQHTAQRQNLRALTAQPPAVLQAWIIHDDPTTVNHFLTALCQTIIITPMYELTVVWR